ncbi:MULTISPECIES: Crp/Fnr family transcriptional regulator [unclassified Bosea (in: a-proteobacteria)]|uniref:Crp/Fnr family transcriptional regulator n=1 Tax=unclassified Bosea (in: a-proteobacteria) TaxID=2653178 RepID=UPI000F761F51|nr:MULTISPECIES: Crp/Fnr family transcriptional regulator [unclassified Bosea (in: a-proteobacteria)]AZO82162.1 Crp/Fnr family transcriptional regulator [Bosea sp. Tri-49]MCV9937093.1 Crp/Fnr family transcriptional regulator [Boseaceae bacterium BT-24-1]RXT20729.1 Crp/Fnr family transcriptional regulator [Bosea sp. Tri-39]RXT33723.1 Crp/Fnr family transcriptional regulator [Bosea sp. Tri-54]
MDKREHLEKLVRKLETITSLSEEERGLLLELPVSVRPFDAYQDIVSEGERTKQCCLVIEGLVCRYKIVGSGERQILSLHIPGDIPDLHSLHIEEMDHSLGTLTAATVGFIPHDAVRRITRASYRVAEAFWREALIDASIFREWMVGIGRRSAPSRIAHFLCEFITKMKAIGLSDGHTCNLPMTQTEIADALGLSTVHINKKLRELRQAKLVRIRANRITVLDWDKLCELGEFDARYLHLRK